MKSKKLLFCKTCQTLSDLVDTSEDGLTLTLHCGHTRTLALPAQGISLEAINSPAGRKLFPAPKFPGNTVSIIEGDSAR